MDRVVCRITGFSQGRRVAVVAACMLAVGIAACSSPILPRQVQGVTIQPAPPTESVALPPAVQLTSAPPPTTMEPSQASVSMANPASTYCLQRGGQLEFSTSGNGDEVGICVSPGGGECEEWVLLRGSCTW